MFFYKVCLFGQVVFWLIVVAHNRGKQLKAVRKQLAQKSVWEKYEHSHS